MSTQVNLPTIQKGKRKKNYEDQFPINQIFNDEIEKKII